MADYNLDEVREAIEHFKKEQNNTTLSEIKTALNRYYKDSTCKGVIYTNNTDKIFFGMCVLPVVSDKMAVEILQNDNTIRLKEYYIEIDSKLMSPMLGLNTDEITAILLHEVGHLVNDATPVEKLRKQIDIYLARNAETLSITDSIYYRNILAFGFSDALRKMTSVFYETEEVTADSYVIKLGYGGPLESALGKIQKKSLLINKDVRDKLVLLCWVLRLYKNVKIRRIQALRAIRKSKSLTPSEIEKKELDKLDNNLRRIDDSSLLESVLLEFTKPNDKIREMKIRGMKGFEQDYYEYNMIYRNVTDQDEALWLMRNINLRIAVIEDYIKSETSDEVNNKRWVSMYDKYLDLRDNLSKKLVYKDRFVGLQVNYPAIKGLDY